MVSADMRLRATREAVPLQTTASPGSRLRSGAFGLPGASMQAVATGHTIVNDGGRAPGTAGSPEDAGS
jgi:hypothetical protein